MCKHRHQLILAGGQRSARRRRHLRRRRVRHRLLRSPRGARVRHRGVAVVVLPAPGAVALAARATLVRGRIQRRALCPAADVQLRLELVRAQVVHVQRRGEGHRLHNLALGLRFHLVEEAHDLHRQVCGQSRQPRGLGPLGRAPQCVGVLLHSPTEAFRHAQVEVVGRLRHVALEHEVTALLGGRLAARLALQGRLVADAE
mmetsp:Transcript_7349/g.22239  ORF Transcript_7349/g.22239 Transcript_7349/m.22239 type:complete len:201 (+) Transcript_7349:1377-1979(+)